MYEQSTHSKPSMTNMLLAPNSRSHLLPQGGYTGGGGTLMAPSKTIARRPGQNTQVGQVGCSLVWTWWNLLEHYLTTHSPMRHARCSHVRVHGCACYTKIWTASTYLGSILTNEYKSCMQKTNRNHTANTPQNSQQHFLHLPSEPQHIYPCT